MLSMVSSSYQATAYVTRLKSDVVNWEEEITSVIMEIYSISRSIQRGALLSVLLKESVPNTGCWAKTVHLVKNMSNTVGQAKNQGDVRGVFEINNWESCPRPSILMAAVSGSSPPLTSLPGKPALLPPLLTLKRHPVHTPPPQSPSGLLLYPPGPHTTLPDSPITCAAEKTELPSVTGWIWDQNLGHLVPSQKPTCRHQLSNRRNSSVII